ncbi:MAG: hypothetical protein ACREOS_11540 [Candidatus Dormibacteraceae bacterium]
MAQAQGYRCPDCGGEFSSQAALEQHAHQAHASERRKDMRGTPLVAGGIAGLIAGIVMAMWAMIVAAVMGAGLLAPPQMIAEPLFGPFHMGTFSAGAFVAGLIVHMMFAITFGVIFALIWRSIAQGGIQAVIGGMIYGLIVWVVMSYLVAPIVGSHIPQEMPVWAWVVAHLMFGVVLGLWPVVRPAGIVQSEARPQRA